MADEVGESDFCSSIGNPISLSSSPTTCVVLQKHIDSLQHQNKLLKIELETYKLMEVEVEFYKVRGTGDMLRTEPLQSHYINSQSTYAQCSGCVELQKAKL
jgi:hypothetical protein